MSSNARIAADCRQQQCCSRGREISLAAMQSRRPSTQQERERALGGGHCRTRRMCVFCWPHFPFERLSDHRSDIARCAAISAAAMSQRACRSTRAASNHVSGISAHRLREPMGTKAVEAVGVSAAAVLFAWAGDFAGRHQPRHAIEASIDANNENEH